MTRPAGSPRGGTAAGGLALLVGLVGLVAGSLAARGLRRWPPGGRGRWSRTNHAGREVTLLEGPAVVASAGVAAVVGGSSAAALATVAAGALGVLDDLTGDTASKGLAGHLRALRSGTVTTGAVKVVGLVATGALVAVATQRSPSRGAPPAGHRGAPSLTATLATLALDTGVVAGSANLVNLLDLRPGRALKATVLLGAPLALAGSPAAAAAVGAAVAALPDDLAGRSMLGDTGANGLGALLGTAVVERLGTVGRAGVLAALTALTLASERVSFTRVIEATPVLRELDAWGRPPTGRG